MPPELRNGSLNNPSLKLLTYLGKILEETNCNIIFELDPTLTTDIVYSIHPQNKEIIIKYQFYVAITRAKDQLYLISPAIVQSYRGDQTVRLSPFISELNPKVYRKSKVEFMDIDK